MKSATKSHVTVFALYKNYLLAIISSKFVLYGAGYIMLGLVHPHSIKTVTSINVAVHICSNVTLCLDIKLGSFILRITDL